MYVFGFYVVGTFLCWWYYLVYIQCLCEPGFLLHYNVHIMEISCVSMLLLLLLLLNKIFLVLCYHNLQWLFLYVTISHFQHFLLQCFICIKHFVYKYWHFDFHSALSNFITFPLFALNIFRTCLELAFRMEVGQLWIVVKHVSVWLTCHY